MMAGISAAWNARETATTTLWLTATATGAAIALLLYFLSRRRHLRKAFALAIYACIALSSATLAQAAYERTETEWPDESRVWTAQITEVGKHTADGISADAKLFNATRAFEGKCVRLKMAGEGAKEILPGDELAFSGQICKAWTAGNPGDFDYHSYLLTHGISGTAFITEESWTLLKDNTASSMRTKLLRIREKLTRQYALYFEKEQKSILSALTLGDKTELDAETRQLFSDTGTSHILALSGLHLSILFALLNMAILRWLRNRRWYLTANVGVIIGLWLFVLLAGSPLSLLRSAWMFTLLQTGACLRPSTGLTLNNLCFAAIVLLCVSPLALFDVSFQMSFSAVAGIILVGQYLWKRFPLPERDNLFEKTVTQNPSNPSLKKRFQIMAIQTARKCDGFFRSTIWPFVTVSLSAQWATLPFIVYYFHNAAPYAFVANFIVIPAAYLLLGGALVFFLLPLPFLQNAIAFFMDCVIDIMTSGLEFVSHWPGARLTLYLTVPTLFAIIIVPCLIYAFLHVRYRRRRIRLAIASTLLVAGSLAAETYRLWPNHVPPQVIVYNISRTTVIHFISSAQHSYIYSSEPPATSWKRMRHVENNYFAPHHISCPILLTQKSIRKGALLREDCFFKFCGKKIFLLHEDVRNAEGTSPFPIDVLVVSRGCYEPLSAVIKVFAPRQIVLDSTLSTHLREQWKCECRTARLPLHDTRTDGAFILPLSKPKP